MLGALLTAPPPLPWVSWVTGAVVMVVGVVVPIGWFILKNKQAVQGAWGAISSAKSF